MIFNSNSQPLAGRRLASSSSLPECKEVDESINMMTYDNICYAFLCCMCKYIYSKVYLYIYLTIYLSIYPSIHQPHAHFRRHPNILCGKPTTPCSEEHQSLGNIGVVHSPNRHMGNQQLVHNECLSNIMD